MACFYYKGKKKYTNPADMIREFVADNRVLDSSASIFSSREIQKNIVNRIKQLNNPEAYGSKEYVRDIQFISSPNLDVFSRIAGLENVERLTPEYIEANRARNYILEQLKEDIDIKRDTFVDNDRLAQVLEDPKIAAADKDLVKTILAEYESVLEIEEGTKDIAGIIKSFVISSVRGKAPKNMELIFNELYKKPNAEKIYGQNTSENRQNWYNKIIDISEKIKKKVTDKGYVLTDLQLVSTQGEGNESVPKVSSKLDIVAVDSNGNTHIFEIKTSKKRYENWDSAKKLTVDWALAIKRQMLGQSIDINKVMLYVIPIAVDSLGDPNKLVLQNMDVRTNDETAGLRDNGYINVVADRLLPRKIFPVYNSEVAEKLKSRLVQVIDEKYEVRTDAEETSVANIVKIAERAYQRNQNSFKFYNSYVGIEGIPKDYMVVTPKSQTPQDVAAAKVEFEGLIQRYVDFVKLQDNRGVAIIYDAITHALSSDEALVTSKHQKRLRHILYEYLNKDWETIDIKEGIPMGMVVLRNKKSGLINLFSLSVDQFRAQAVKGEYTDKSLEGTSYKELDILKSMIFLDQFRDELLPNKAYKMGQLITFDPKSGDNFYTPMTDALKIYKDRMFKKGLHNEVKIKESDLSGIEDVAMNDFYSVINNYEGIHRVKLDGIAEMLGNGHVNDISEARLKTALAALLKAFPDYVTKTTDTKLNFDDPIEVIIALLQTSILTKSEIELHGDFRDLTKYSFQYADFKSLITSLYQKNPDQYDKLGNKIQGLFQGLTWSSPENIQSKDIRQINEMIAIGNSVIGQDFMRRSEKIMPFSKQYYESIGYGKLERMTVGETQSKHTNFFLPGKQYVTKNPYKHDAVNTLSSDGNKYLKNMLFFINTDMLGISAEEAASIDVDSEESLRSNESIANALDSGEYFEMPLMRRDEMSKYKGALKTNGGNTLNMKAIAQDNIRSWIDGRELSKHDLINIRSQSKGYFHMYDPYSGQRGDIRAKMLQDRNADYYEMNLDTIAHKVAFTKIRKQKFDLILPTINAYIWWIKLNGAKSSTDLEMKSVENTIEYIVNQVKLAVFDEHLIGNEEAALAKGASFAKQISTVHMLAFRPALTAKEMTIGVLKNFSAAGIGLDPEYNMKDMSKAYGKLITIDNKFSEEFNLIDKINHFYRIANMDISSIPKKFQTDRYGVAKGLGHYMFMTSTIGDYYNRLAMLLSKMIHEGSYDAHTFVDGELKYDVTKDERFSKYLAERERVKDSDGNYTVKEGDAEYNKQRRRYLWSIEQMNKEGKLTKETKLTEKDLIDKAYTHLERNSVKATTDQMYGAYDKDAQSHINNTLFGIAFMQFLTYWPNKVKFYFGKKIESEDSSIGQVKQATQEDNNGVEHKLWYKEVTDANGIQHLEWTTEDTGDPVWGFKGTPQEGTFIATMGIIQDVFRQDWSNIKKESLRNRRAVFGLVDAGLLFLILGMMREMWKWVFNEQEDGTVSKEAVKFMGVVNEKVYREFNVWENTFGAISTEPLWLNWTQRTLKGVKDVISGDQDIAKLATNSIGALEMFK